MKRIYLDNAATTWPKPECVYRAVENYMREVGTSGGRGAYRTSLEADELVQQARLGIARLVELEEPQQVVFGSNGTDVLNQAIQGLVRPGDHVVTTVCEHNSVLRPLYYLHQHAQVDVTYVSCDQRGYVDPAAVQAALRPTTRLVAIVHASNVTGALQPVEEIGRRVRDHAAFYLVDAAQTLGHVRLNLPEIYADLIAAPGHKGLLGPLGTGVLCVTNRAAEEIVPLKRGGTGTMSDMLEHPQQFPHRLESGNLNTLGLAGLAAAVEFLQPLIVEEIGLRIDALTQRLLRELQDVDGVTLYGPLLGQPRVGVVSFNMAGFDPQELAALLEMTHGIECRAGLHCAPRMHEALSTVKRGGSVRLSLGWATTETDIDAVVDAVSKASETTFA